MSRCLCVFTHKLHRMNHQPGTISTDTRYFSSVCPKQRSRHMQQQNTSTENSSMQNRTREYRFTKMYRTSSALWPATTRRNCYMQHKPFHKTWGGLRLSSCTQSCQIKNKYLRNKFYVPRVPRKHFVTKWFTRQYGVREPVLQNNTFVPAP
jgi:hypothetical protein